MVLATSIAESSLTIEGVRAVVDSGMARVPVQDATSGLTRLDTLPASLASADQRRGRAGAFPNHVRLTLSLLVRVFIIISIIVILIVTGPANPKHEAVGIICAPTLFHGLSLVTPSALHESLIK